MSGDFDNLEDKNEKGVYEYDTTEFTPVNIDTSLFLWSKRILITINLLFFILAIVMIFVAIHAYNSIESDINPYNLSIGVMVLGIFIALVSFLGFFGAWYESRPLLILYLIINLLLFISQVVTAGYIFYYRGDSVEYLERGWKRSPHELIKNIQDRLNCCGFDVFNETSVPCPTTATTSCMDILVTHFKKNEMTLGQVALIIVVLQVISLILSLLLCGSVGQEIEYEPSDLQIPSNILTDGKDPLLLNQTSELSEIKFS